LLFKDFAYAGKMAKVHRNLQEPVATSLLNETSDVSKFNIFKNFYIKK